MKTALRLSSVVLAILTFPLLAAAQLETIDGTARGTSTQLGHTVSIKVIITRYSTPEDKQTLVNAFSKVSSKGWSMRSRECSPPAAFRYRERWVSI